MFRHLSIKAIVIPFIVIVLSMVIYSLWNPLDNSNTIGEFYNSHPDAGPDAESWGRGGSYFLWKSSLPENSQLPELNIFYRTFYSYTL